MTNEPPPPAAGVRIEWDALPESVRARVETWLGSPVVEAKTQFGGFSPGVAAKLLSADGRRIFVKAVGAEPNRTSPKFHRRELAIVAAIPASAPVPRLLWSHDESEADGGWVTLAFESVDGHPPAQPWDAVELARVMASLADLSEALTPSPLPAGSVPALRDWVLIRNRYWARTVATAPDGLDTWSARHAPTFAAMEAKVGELAAGETLLHLDIRGDNILLTGDRVWIVDWPHAHIGAAWVDLLLMAPSVAMQGGPPPAELFLQHPAGRTAPDEAVTAMVAMMAGFFTWEALQPPPPGLPTLRPFQAAQAAVAREWLRQRTGLN